MSTPAKLTRALLAACLTLAGTCVCANQAQPRLASSVEITILSSNLADGATVGEWGFSALARTGDACVLFDAGRHPDTVIRNVRALGVDLSCVTDLVLSHFHFDHTTGVLPLLEQMQAQHGSAFRRIHVAEGFFLPRRLPDQTAEWNGMIAAKDELERRGVEIIEHGTAAEILPGIWVTGPVIRTHAEKTYPKAIRMYLDGDWVEDYVPDSQGMVIATARGPIVLLGCGHSGSINLLEQVRRSIQDQPIHALMGGMHLYAADDQTLSWTASHLRQLGLEHLMAGHCTGVEPLVRLRNSLDLDRSTAVVGAVGSRFVLGEGIHPTAIAQ